MRYGLRELREHPGRRYDRVFRRGGNCPRAVVGQMPRRREHDDAMRAGEPRQRQLRVGEELRHALAQLLRPGELRDPALYDANVTVTEVRVSPDLRNATAYVMPLGGANTADIMEALRRSAPFLKGRIARP